MRLLLAEDDPANQLVDRTLLARLGHAVEAVNDGAEALARLAEGGFDAVVLDCQMPGVDGYEAARRIRAGEVPGLNPRIPIVALTAEPSRAVRERCRTAGFDACLGKPLNLREMQAALAGNALTAESRPRPADVLDSAHWEGMRAAGTLLADFLALFYRDEPARIAGLAALAARRDGAELARTAHTLAGSAAMLGARDLQLAAAALERAAAVRRWDDVTSGLQAIDAAWRRLRERLAAEGHPGPQ